MENTVANFDTRRTSSTVTGSPSVSSLASSFGSVDEQIRPASSPSVSSVDDDKGSTGSIGSVGVCDVGSYDVGVCDGSFGSVDDDDGSDFFDDGSIGSVDDGSIGSDFSTPTRMKDTPTPARSRHYFELLLSLLCSCRGHQRHPKPSHICYSPIQK
jgi:hypothetical protein